MLISHSYLQTMTLAILLEDKVIPHKIFNKGGIKVGIGIELKGLVDPKLYGNTQYLDPVSVANKKPIILGKS